MNDKSPEELMVRWMDGEKLNPEELDVLKKMHAEDPSWAIDPKEFAPVAEALHTRYSSDLEVPQGKLFQDTLMKRVAQEREHEQEIARLQEKVTAFPQRSAASFNWAKVAVGMAACFLFGILVNTSFFKRPQPTQSLSHVYPAPSQLQPVVYSVHDNLSADFLSVDEQNVIVIEGLDAIPDNIDLFALSYPAPPSRRQPIKVTPHIHYPLYEN